MSLIISRLVLVGSLVVYLAVDLVQAIAAGNHSDIVGSACVLLASICLLAVTCVDQMVINTQSTIIADLKAMIRNNSLVYATEQHSNAE